MKVSVVCHVRISPDEPIHGHYYPNRAPLQSVPFQKLPPGSIEPDSWLLGQLRLQLNGLNGQLSQISDYLVYEKCGWIDPSQSAWEELPYWLRGFADLGFVTKDAETLNLANRWIDGILNSQQADGWFGPDALRTSLNNGPDLWPAMPLIHVFRSLYDFNKDQRVIPFLIKYFQYVNSQEDAVFTRGWSFTRWADNIDSIIWLYNRTNDTDWLLDLVKRIHKNSADWISGLPTLHNVNLAQGFREPALYSLVVDPVDPSLMQATNNNYKLIMNQYGQFPGGGFAGDEVCRPGFSDPRQGFETCGIVEFMHSFEILTRITGESIWSDRCEILAINSLPAAFDPFQARTTHYITCANCIVLDDQAKTDGEFYNNWPMLAYKPGVHDYRCCTHNHGMGWPYYAEECWLATYDGGLCASMFVSSKVTALVGPGDGIQVTIQEETDYPFDGKVQFKIQISTPTQFKLYIRVPGWCTRQPTIKYNGEQIFQGATPNDGSFLVLDHLWTDNDIIHYTIPMNIRNRIWPDNKNALSISYGPMTFALGIAEQYNRIGGTDDWPEFEVVPKSNWNYGVVLSQKNRWQAIRKKRTNMRGNIFTRNNIPINIEVIGRPIPQWTADSQNVVEQLPMSPVSSDEPEESLTLIPMGAARLRITAFPTIQS